MPGRAAGARVAAASGLGTVPASWSLCSISGGTLRNTKMYQVGRKSWPPGARLGLLPVGFSSVQLEKMVHHWARALETCLGIVVRKTHQASGPSLGSFIPESSVQPDSGRL